MWEIAHQLEGSLAAGHRVGVVTVAVVHGSAPRTVGSSMAVTDSGEVIGAISGGCVESEAYELARAALSGELGIASTELGLSDDDALTAGLSCGGHLSVVASVLEPGDRAAREQLRRAAAGRAARLDIDLATGAVRMVDAAATPVGTLRIAREDSPRLIIVGAVDFAAALATAARPLGYRITVVDARPAFATAARHPDAHEVVRAWPGDYLAATGIGPRDVICVLTHEERFDIPALVAALASPARFVGAMGSRRTDARRRELLAEEGLDERALSRLRSPIGLDLGGVTPAQTAISIVAQIVADAHGREGGHLTDRTAAIHALG